MMDYLSIVFPVQEEEEVFVPGGGAPVSLLTPAPAAAMKGIQPSHHTPNNATGQALTSRATEQLTETPTTVIAPLPITETLQNGEYKKNMNDVDDNYTPTRAIARNTPEAEEREPMNTEEKLQAAMEFVRLVAEDWFVYGEMYQECFFCQEIEPGDTDHKADCPVLKAQALLRTQDTTQERRTL